MWCGAAGWSEFEPRRPMQADRLFGIGSITKTFVSVILHQLAAEGRLSLDATPASILGPRVEGIGNVERATLRQLMNHTSGIPSWEDAAEWQREGRGALLEVDRTWGKEDTLAYIRGEPALFAPGERYSYSNSNFTILGLVVEAVTGNDLVEVIERRIRRPAALDSVFLEGFEPVPEERLAGRHHFATPDFRDAAGVNAAFPEIEGGLIDVSASNLSVEWAAGGMVASAGDLARYGVAIFDGTLLSDEALDALLTFRPIQWSSPADEAAEPEPVLETGYGLFRRRLGAFRVLGHAGDVLGYSAWLYYEPTSQVALSVLANAGTMHAGPGVGAGGTILRDDRFIAAAIAAARASRGPLRTAGDIHHSRPCRYTRPIAEEHRRHSHGRAVSSNVASIPGFCVRGIGMRKWRPSCPSPLAGTGSPFIARCGVGFLAIGLKP